MAISKAYRYGKYGNKAVRQHGLWKEGRMGDEALRFLLTLTSDREFRKAIKEFNSQVDSMKYGGWLDAFDKGDSTELWAHMAQLGQMLYNFVKWLKDTGYLKTYSDRVTTFIKPYWCSPSDYYIRRQTNEKIIGMVAEYYKKNRKYPTLKAISTTLSIPRYMLIQAGFTRDVIHQSYLNFKKTGKYKVIKPPKEYVKLTEQDTNRIAVDIAKRMFMP